MDRTVDGVFDEWSGGVRRSPKGCGRTETSERGRTTREMEGNGGEWLGRHRK